MLPSLRFPVQRIVTAHQSRILPAMVCRWMSVDGIKGFSDKERASEQIYFNKEEERLLRNLLSKMKSQADKHDAQGAKSVEANETVELQSIVAKYKMSDSDIKALLAWKHKSF